MHYIVLIMAVLIGYVIYLFLIAPVGYEDNKGFHFKQKNRDFKSTG
ncbi:MAG: hypothetical protein Kow0098_27660 [Ignavibacteriaceae bacterium]